MSLVKWEPMHELSRLRDEMDRVFGHMAGEVFPADGQKWGPAVDVREEDDRLIVKADLPGVKKDDVDITATEDSITIQGHSEEEKEEKKDGYYRRERHSGSFSRVLPLPAMVDADKAQAEFKDGTVTITLPKVAKAPKGRKVEVR
jgi:HSP20 family protein